MLINFGKFTNFRTFNDLFDNYIEMNCNSYSYKNYIIKVYIYINIKTIRQSELKF